MTDIERRVARGMAVLDHFYPDFEFRVKPEDITSIASDAAWSCKVCALDCVGGFREAGVRVFGVAYVASPSEIERQYDDCAFVCEVKDDAAFVLAWREAIRLRRAKALLVDNAMKAVGA